MFLITLNYSSRNPTTIKRFRGRTALAELAVLRYMVYRTLQSRAEATTRLSPRLRRFRHALFKLSFILRYPHRRPRDSESLILKSPLTRLQRYRGSWVSATPSSRQPPLLENIPVYIRTYTYIVCEIPGASTRTESSESSKVTRCISLVRTSNVIGIQLFRMYYYHHVYWNRESQFSSI